MMVYKSFHDTIWVIYCWFSAVGVSMNTGRSLYLRLRQLPEPEPRRGGHTDWRHRVTHHLPLSCSLTMLKCYIIVEETTEQCYKINIQFSPYFLQQTCIAHFHTKHFCVSVLSVSHHNNLMFHSQITKKQKPFCDKQTQRLKL